MKHPWIEEADPNIFILRFPADRTRQETEAMWKAIDAHYEQTPSPAPFGWIFDLGKLETSRAGERAMVADHARRHNGYLRHYCVGLAVVVHSAFARGVVQAVSWLVSNKPIPFKTVPSLEAGKEWLGQRRIDRGVR